MKVTGIKINVKMLTSLASRRLFCAVAEATPPAAATLSRWQRIKGSRAGLWFRGLLSDYKEAFRDAFVSARERPGKAAVYMIGLGATGACIYTKPEEVSFQETLLDASNQLCLLSPWIRSPPSDGHVQDLVKKRNEGRLRYISLAVLSMVYLADFDPETALYDAQCSDLSVPWRELPHRVLDVGFAGRWWILDSKMKNYDVNENEYTQLPVEIQQTSPPSVRQVERNEELHKESWLPVKMSEDDATEVQ